MSWTAWLSSLLSGKSDRKAASDRRKSQRRRAFLRSMPAAVETLEARRVLATFMVDSLGDTIAADGVTTLREAITSANSAAGADTIAFNTSAFGPGMHVITLTSALPTMTGPTTIDGTTQPGYSGSPLIAINNNGLTSTVLAFSGATANGSAVKGLKLAGFTSLGIQLTNVDNAVLQDLDLSDTPGNYSNQVGVQVETGSDNVTISNVNASGMSTAGIKVISSLNPTIQNNQVRDSGIGIQFLNVTGIGVGAVTGNKFDGDVIGLQLENGQTGLSIGDASVATAHIRLEDGTSGLTSTSRPLNFLNVDNATIDNVDMSNATTVRTGEGLRADSGSDFLVIQNSNFANRTSGLITISSKDLTLNNNAFTNNSEAISLQSPLKATAAAVLVGAGNTFANSASVLRINVMAGANSGLTIGPSAANFVIDNATGGLTSVNGTVFNFSNADGVTISGLNVSYGGVGQVGTAVFSDTGSDNLTIQNVTANNRSNGINLTGGQDLIVTGCSLTNSGTAIVLNSLTDGADADSLPFKISNNDYARSSTAFQFFSMSNVTAGISGTEALVIDNATSGLKTVTGTVFYLRSVPGATFSDLDLSYSGAGRVGTGFFNDVNLGSGSVFQNLKLKNRAAGINISAGATDLRILNNDLSNNGTAISLSAIADGGDADTQPIIASGNVMTDSSVGWQVFSTSNQFFGTSGTGIIINNATDGLQTVGTPLYLRSVGGATIDGLDLTYAGNSRAGTGIYSDVNMGAGVVIRNVTSTNRSTGIDLSAGAADLTLTNNDLSNNDTAASLASVSDGGDADSVPIIASGNKVTNSGTGLFLNNISGQFIGTSGTGIIINNALDGFTTNAVRSLLLRSMSGLTVDGVDFSYSGPTRSGEAAYSDVNIGGGVTFNNVTARNRVTGVNFTAGGNDLTLTNNDFSNDTNSVVINSFSDGGDANTVPIVASGNKFTNSANGLYLLNVASQRIATTGTGIIIDNANDGLTTSSSFAVRLSNTDSVTVDGLDLSWTSTGVRTGVGLVSEGQSDNVTITNVTAANRTTGVDIENGTVLNVSNSTFTNNDKGIISNTVGTSSTLSNNTIQGNTTGVQAQGAGVQVNASNNYWGSSAGPGAGGNNGFTGNVLATPFSTSAPAGAPPVPVSPPAAPLLVTSVGTSFQVTNNSDVVNGDTTSITALVANQGSDGISLREAITAANNTAGADTITFAIASGAQTIRLGSILPTVTGPLTIDGTTQPGFASTPLIVIDAFGLGGDLIKFTNANTNALKSLKITNYAGTAVRLSNADNTTLQGLDLSNPLPVFGSDTGIYADAGSDNLSVVGVNTTGATSFGLRVESSVNPTVQNSTFNQSSIGMLFDTVTGVTVGAVTGNQFANDSVGLRLMNMSGMTIGDAGVSGSHIVLPDGASGLGTTVTPISVRNLDNSTINNVDVSWTGPGPRASLGIFGDWDGSLAGRSSGLSVINVTAQNRSTGIQITGGADLTVTGNVLTATTSPGIDTGIYLDDVIDGADVDTAPVSMSSNVVTNALVGLKLFNMSGASIGTTAGNPVRIDNVADDLDTTNLPLYLKNFDNATIDGVALGATKLQTARLGTGIQLDWDGTTNGRSSGLTISNVTATDRALGFNLRGTTDLVLQNNTLRSNSTALQIDSAIDGADAGTAVLSAAGNVVTDSDTGLKLLGVTGVTIGSSGDDFLVNNSTDGWNTLRGSAIYLSNVNSATLSNLNLSWGGLGRAGIAVYADGTNNNLTVSSVNAANRAIGLRIGDAGQDATFTNNTLTNNSTGMFLNGLSDGADANTVPVVASGNNFAGSDTPLQIQAVAGQFIGTSGVGIIINNATDGVANAASQSIRLQNVSGMTINGIDASYTGVGRAGTGVYADGTNNNLTITGVNAANRGVGLRIGDAGQDATFTNNTLTNNSLGLFLNGQSDGADANTVPVVGAGNNFAGSDTAIQMQGIAGQFVGTAGTGLIVNNATDGMQSAVSIGIRMANVTNMTIDGVDLSYNGARRTGTGIYLDGTNNNLAIRNVSTDKRSLGLRLGDSGQDLIVENNQLTNNDLGLFISGYTDGADANTSAFTGSGNRFTGTKDAIYLQGMAATLVIGNSDVAGVNFSIDASSDLTSAYGAAISLNNASNVTIDGVDLSLRGLTRNGTGVNARSTPNNFVLKNSSVINRSTGLLYNPDSTAANNTAKVSNSDFINNDVGISLTQHVAGGFVNGNRIEANGTGLAYGTGTSTTLDATGNYWGPNSSGAPGTGGNNGVSVSPVSLVTTTGFVATPPSALNRDYGDDPLSYGFSTRIGAFGARHMAAGPQLGALRDSEADAPTTIFANSDDTTGVDDEDGVSIGALTAGASATALVTVSGGASKLDAWIDFNRDGDWNDAGEKIANSLAVVNGVNTITFSVPAGATIGANYARFRLSTQGGLSPDGLASNGEVEDYVAGDAYVDDAWSGPSFPNGTAIADADPVAAGAQGAIIGLNAFSSVAAALNAAASGGLGRVIVNAGDYSADAATIAHSGLVLRFQEGNSTVGGLDDSVTDASIVLAGVTLTVGGNNASTQLDSPISGTGSLVKSGTGTLTLAAAETFSGSTTINGGSLALSLASNNNLASPTITVASGATLNVAGLASSRFDLASGQTLQGVGAVAGGTLKLQSGATVSPATAATTGVLSTAGLILTAGATYSAQVNGSVTAGADYDQLQVVGAVDLGGATLSIGGGITSVLNDIVLVNNDGTDPVVGTFAGLPEGAPLTINGVNVYITYVGGTGNDVVLNVPGIVLGTNGDDTMVVEPLAGGAVRYTLNNDAPKTIPAGVGTFTFNGIGGDDTMIVNLNANALIGGGYVFNGGSQASPLSGGGNTGHGDVLKIVGTGSETANFLGDGVANASLDNDGAVVIPGLGTIQYTGLEPVDLQGFSTVNVRFANGPEALTIAGGVDAATNTNPALVVSGTSGGVAFEAVHLRGNTNVVIDTTTGGSDGADTVTITGGSTAHGNTNLTITTGAGADSVSVTGSLVVAGALSISAETIGVTGSLATGAGTLTLSARDDVSIGTSGALTSVSGNILVTGDSDSSGATGGAITMASSGSIDAGSGAVTLTASENIAVGFVATTNGSASAAVAITSNFGAVTDANGGETNVTAGNGGATVTAASGISLGTTVDFITATITDSGDIAIAEADGLDGLNLNAGAGQVTLTVATGGVQDSDANVDVTAANLNATVSSGSFGATSTTAGAAIQTTLATISVDTSGGNGSQFILETNGWTGLSLAAGTGAIAVASTTGDITDGDASSDVTAASFTASLPAGNLGATAALPIHTAVSRFEAATSGLTSVSNTGDLQLGGASASFAGVTTTAGAIAIRTTGDLSQSEQLVAGGAGSSIDLQTNGSVTLPAGQLVQAGTSGSYGLATILFDADNSGGATATFAADVDALGLTITGSGSVNAFVITPDQDATIAQRTPITLVGGAPTTSPGDTLQLDTTGLGTPTLVLQGGQGNGQYQFGAAANVTYSSIESVTTSPASSCFNLLLNMTIAGFAGGLATDVVAIVTPSSGTGLSVTVNGASLLSTAVSQVCQLSFVGSADNDVVDFSAIAGPLQLTLSALGTVDGVQSSVGLPISTTSGPGTLNYTLDNVDKVIGSSASGSSLTSGDQLIQGMAVATMWFMSATIPGRLTMVGTSKDLDFEGWENLIGADGAQDRFFFAPGGAIGGRIDGRGQAPGTSVSSGDILDFTSAGASVSVDLATGVSTRLGGTIVPDATGSSIEVVLGSTLGDTLSGDGDANVLSGNSGPDLLNGRGGVDQIDGGDGDDTISISGNEAETDQMQGGLGNDQIINVGTGPAKLSGFNSSSTAFENSIEKYDGGGKALLGNDATNQLHFSFTQFTNTPSVQGGLGDDDITTSLNNNSGGAPVAYDGGDGLLDHVTLLFTPSQLAALTATDFPVLQSYVVNPTGQTLTVTGSAAKGNLLATNFEKADIAVADDGQIIRITSCFTALSSRSQLIVGDEAAADSLTGTPLADLIFGQGGNDWINGVAGNDCIFGGAGADSLWGETGIDQIYGGSGDDVVSGGLDADQIDGGAGNDQLAGDAGSDVVRGGVGNDTLLGGGEPDTLNGGAGVDSVSGDAGPDRIEVTSNEAEFDTMTGGADLDELFFLAGGGAVTLNGFDVATTSLESIQANSQALLGNSAANNFSFTAVQLLQLPYVDAAGGNDVVQGSAGNDVIYGGDGDDNLSGGAGADQIDGGIGVDSVYGGGGDDSVGGGAGNDYVEGNDGNDVFVVRGAEASGDTLRGGTNTDRILNTGGSSISMASISGVSMQIEIWDNAGFALLGTNDANVFDLRLDLIGTTTFQMLNTPNISLLGGNDTVYGTNYDDFLIGGLGNDTLYGFTGNDTLFGNSGDDVLDGGNGNDLIFGDSIGESGVDTLTGGGGTDYFSFVADYANLDVVTDYTTSDFIRYVGFGAVSYANVGFVPATQTLTLTVGASVKSVKLNGVTTKPTSTRVQFL